MLGLAERLYPLTWYAFSISAPVRLVPWNLETLESFTRRAG